MNMQTYNSVSHAVLAQKYGIIPEAFLASGIEATVYTYGDRSVLKVYDRTTTLQEQQILQHFYASLDTSKLSYTLPQIYSVIEEQGLLITIEKKLSGRRMSDILHNLADSSINTYSCIVSCALTRIPRSVLMGTTAGASVI